MHRRGNSENNRIFFCFLFFYYAHRRVIYNFFSVPINACSKKKKKNQSLKFNQFLKAKTSYFHCKYKIIEKKKKKNCIVKKVLSISCTLCFISIPGLNVGITFFFLLLRIFFSANIYTREISNKKLFPRKVGKSTKFSLFLPFL